jgi:U3 small nucleolar RNA-associated protein 14
MLSERRDKSLAALQLAALPAAFPSRSALDAANKTPLGAEWNTAQSAAALAKPAWTTRVGTIIEPIKPARAAKGAPAADVRSGLPALTTGQGARRVR